MASSLEDIRVLDLSRVLAGPVCTQILGDLGAEVIKIERPGHGDDTRKWGPPYLQDDAGNDTTESAYYLSCNRNKKSVTIDIKTDEGQKLIHRLIEKSDVLIHNFKVGNLRQYGLDYDQLKDNHSHLIYCAISGYGQTGPLAAEPGYDFLAQALGGLMANTGGPDMPPTKVGVALSDVMTGLYSAIGILSALHHREKTGQGQMIDLSLLDCTLAGMTNIAQYYLTSGTLAPRRGNAHSTIVPYQAFEAEDGYLVLAVGNDSQFARLADALDQKSWITDERFATNDARVRHRDDLTPQIENIIKTRNVSDWTRLFYEIDVPAAPVQNMDEVFTMDQIKDRQMKLSMPHPAKSDPVDLVGSPLKLSETPVTYRHAPPMLGADTQDILTEILEITAEDIQGLKKRKII